MRLTLVIVGLIALMLAPALFFGEVIDEHFSGDEGLQRLQAYGSWAWLVGIALIVSDLVLPVPATAIITGLGMIYGPWAGGLIGAVGSLLAGLVAYGGCRLLGQRFCNFLVGAENLSKLERFFDRYGLWAIALSRWMPILPEALCCLAGMSRMRFLPFLAALSCGSLAMGLAFGLLGNAYHDRPILGLLISALVPLALWPLIHLSLRRSRPAEVPSETQAPVVN